MLAPPTTCPHRLKGDDEWSLKVRRISSLTRIVMPAASVLAVTVLAGCGALKGDDAAGPGAGGKSAAAGMGSGDKVGMGNGESITIGKSYWHAGWKVDLTAATVRASKEDPAQSVMAIDGMFNNLGKDDAEPKSQLTLEAGGESLPLDDQETELPQVPGGGKQRGTIVFDLKDPAKVTDATLVVGNPENSQATIPFGDGGTLLTQEPRSFPLDLSGSVKTTGATGVKTAVTVKGAELRADDVRRHEESKKDTLFLTVTYAVTTTYTCTCSPMWNPADGLALRLPDGTKVGVDPNEGLDDVVPNTVSGVANPDLKTRFIIKDPTPGDYQLVVRFQGKQKAMPFTIPAA
jgi:hypothetical protein